MLIIVTYFFVTYGHWNTDLRGVIVYMMQNTNISFVANSFVIKFILCGRDNLLKMTL